MSRLCGWFNFSAGAHDDQCALIKRMASMLSSCNGAAPLTVVQQDSAVAVSAHNGDATCYQDPRTLCVVVGRPRWRERQYAEAAQQQGMAASFALAYRERGPQALELLFGAFSLALVDGSEEILLAVDRMGIQSLSYALAAQTIAFGSSAKAINAHPAVQPSIDPQGVFSYMFFHVVPGPATIYRGQYRLLPGTYARYRAGALQVEYYWQPRYVEDQKRSVADLKEEFLTLVQDSVHNAAQGAEVGTFLSGGTDSSTVAGFLTKVSGRPARTYSIGFDAEGYDEMEYARAAAAHFGTVHREYYVTPQDVVAALPRVAATYDQPFGNASAVPTLYCAQLGQADGVARMLGGDGGDELFGGNARYAKQYLFSIYDRLPRALRSGLIEPVVSALPDAMPHLNKLRSYVRQASIPMPERLESYNLLFRLGLDNVFSADFLALVNVGQPIADLTAVYQRVQAASLVNRMLALDWKYTLADNDLPKVVQMCELAGVEPAFPLLDDALVEFSGRLPPNLKLRGTKLRYFFKEALRGFLPDQIIAKRKQGFGLPFGVWLRSYQPLQTFAKQQLNDLRARRIIRPELISELTSLHLDRHAGYYGTMVWVLMMLELWFKQSEVELGF
jgi:asparagine synthase (glutamine-hydrolysing)